MTPTTAYPPPKLGGKEMLSEDYQNRAFSLLSIASVSGCCQVKYSFSLSLSVSGPTVSYVLHSHTETSSMVCLVSFCFFYGKNFEILINFVFLIFQVTVPLGYCDKCPTSVSFIARHGGDRFLLDTVQNMYASLQEQADIATKSKLSTNTFNQKQSAEIAKEKVHNHCLSLIYF